MPMLKDPSRKYKSFKPIPLRDREWPDKTITKVPRWLATDLRDGNQSLPSPLDGEQKLRYFQLLVELGYKEIEVSFPSASQIDYDFTRHLIETPGLVPEDVWLQVISPCREDFIKRTAQSVYGAKKAIFHLYLATSECFRRVVFSNMTEDETLELAVKSTKLARSLTKDSQDPNVRAAQWQYEFTTETFSDTSLDYIIRLCNAVKGAWEPTAENPIIFNLPATVELSTPNIYADQIEYFCRNISERDKVCVCLHPHNDRGCAVAASELAQMAGADRIEGCLFGNGERTGNVDLVTLALNLYTQGISPGLDFSNMSKVISTVEELTKISVHARAPYAGQFAFCAFSGSHQDAIKKGFQSREKHPENERWVMPYLPLDPQDVGRTYEAVIRVNSQSGKGGAAWVVLQRMQLDLPRGLQVAFSKVVQKYSESANRELQPTEIVKLFEDTYFLRSTNVFRLVNYHIRTNRPASRGRFRANGNKRPVESQSDRHFEGVVALDGVETSISGTGNGAISSLVNALAGVGVELTVKDYKGQALNSNKGKNMKSVAYIECSLANGNNGDRSIWGVGINESAEQAGLIALLNAASSLRPFVSSVPNRNLTMGAAGADCLKSKGPQTTVIITEIVNDVD